MVYVPRPWVRLRKVVLWTDAHGAASAAFNDGAFFNINTPEDLTRARDLAAAEDAG